jgi:D-amino-acid dehydrogenase
MSEATDRADIVIVGGGIIGIAAAHYLNKAGRQVTVIDKGTMAGACSQGNCGYICASHILPLTEPEALWTGLKSLFDPKAAFRIRPSLRPELWLWMLQFMRRCNHQQMLTAGKALKALLDSSLQEYHGIMKEGQLHCEWQEKGLLFAFKGERGMEQFASMDRFITKHFGVSADHIDGTDLPAFDPALRPGLLGAFHYPKDTSVRPDILNRQWVENLRGRGVHFIENCSLTDVLKSSEKIDALDTSNGRIEAEQFVFATGAWSSKLAPLLGCRIPVEPGKGYSVTMSRPKNCPAHPMLFPEKRIGVSPFENGYRIGSMMEFVGFDSSIPDQRIQQLRTAAEDYLVEPYTEELLETWFGWRPMTWDSLPIIGGVPNLQNAFLATGHNMLGLATASGSGLLLSEIIQGQTPHIDPAPYSPDRF